MPMTLWRRWVLTVTAAEVAGFGVPAVAGALTATSPVAVSVPALLAAGAVEGLLLGWGQAVVLRRVLPGLERGRWIGLTSAAAVLAYAIGLLPSTLHAFWQQWPPVVLVPVAALLAAVLLNSIGVAQWTVLRGLVPDAGRWVAYSAAAWLAGLAVFLLFSTPLWQPGQALPIVVAIGLAGALLMAATMAAITGHAVRRWATPAVAQPVTRPVTQSRP
ncbi:hypothetical protein AB0C07_12200 [Actinoplanes missouriensis]|uniref:hypothetical protein n=1 Tax=Actinoplanes missouriensis TaxID=1866 RepID=UPI0034095813